MCIRDRYSIIIPACQEVFLYLSIAKTNSLIPEIKALYLLTFADISYIITYAFRLSYILTKEEPVIPKLFHHTQYSKLQSFRAFTEQDFLYTPGK